MDFVQLLFWIGLCVFQDPWLWLHWFVLNVPLKRMCAPSCWRECSYGYSEELSICWRSLIYSYLKPDFPVLFFVWKCLLILFIEKKFILYILIIFPFTNFFQTLCTSLPTHHCSLQPFLPSWVRTVKQFQHSQSTTHPPPGFWLCRFRSREGREDADDSAHPGVLCTWPQPSLCPLLLTLQPPLAALRFWS